MVIEVLGSRCLSGCLSGCLDCVQPPMLKSLAFKPILIPDVVPDFGINFARASRNRDFRRPKAME